MFKMSEAAVVVENLLGQTYRGETFRLDCHKLANKWVAMVYAQKPDLFSGKFGQRPHKISVAAIALANGIEETSHDSEAQSATIAALGIIITDLCANGRFYDFNGIDEALLNLADKAYLARLPG